MKLLGVIKRLVITKKLMLAMDEEKYAFEVNTHANKTLVKQATESAFDARITNVNILNVRPKFRRMGKYAGYTEKHRKTIITLTEDSKEVQLFEAAG